MNRRVLFGLMSAQQSDSTVSQLVDSLCGRPVVVHHDFTKRADFTLHQSNVDFVPDPKVTGWGTWGFVAAILHLLEHALKVHDFDYFQLLSPTCLPIRPIEEFEAFASTDGAEIHADLIDVESDLDTMMSFGYRFIPADTWRFLLLRRVRSWYFGGDCTLVQTRSLSVLRRPADRALPFVGRLGLGLTRLALAGGLGRLPFGEGFRPAIGSTWFGARRYVCEYLLARARDADFVDYFSRLNLIDESLFGNLIANSGFRTGRSNHAVSPFDLRGHPQWIVDTELDRMFTTDRFFARKFPEDVSAAVRHRALDRARAAEIA